MFYANTIVLSNLIKCRFSLYYCGNAVLYKVSLATTESAFLCAHFVGRTFLYIGGTYEKKNIGNRFDRVAMSVLRIVLCLR